MRFAGGRKEDSHAVASLRCKGIMKRARCRSETARWVASSRVAESHKGEPTDVSAKLGALIAMVEGSQS